MRSLTRTVRCGSTRAVRVSVPAYKSRRTSAPSGSTTSTTASMVGRPSVPVAAVMSSGRMPKMSFRPA